MLPALLLLLSPIAQASPPLPPATAPAAAKRQYFVVLLRVRHDLWLRYKATGKWPDDDKAANAALNAHVAYWDKLKRDGTALLAGGMGGDYWDNVAMIVFEAPSLAAAQAIVDADEAVKTYVFQAQVRPFDLSWSQTPRPSAAK